MWLRQSVRVYPFRAFRGRAPRLEPGAGVKVAPSSGLLRAPTGSCGLSQACWQQFSWSFDCLEARTGARCGASSSRKQGTAHQDLHGAAR